MFYNKKINIGCGYDKKIGYVNIDSDPACTPDILIKDNDLSILPTEYFDEDLAIDVLEHIPRAQMMGALFDWVSLLKINARIYISTSSIFGIIDTMRRADTFEVVHNWKTCLFGNQVHPGDWHFNGFTEKTLRVYLRATGLIEEEMVIKDGWLLQCWATKKTNWKELEDIVDYNEFVFRAYEKLLFREPELSRYNFINTVANSKERKSEIKSLVCSEERLYKIGHQMDNL
jgi:hypothetical protein